MNNNFTVHFFTKGDINAGSTRYHAVFRAMELDKIGIKTRLIPPPFSLKFKNNTEKRIAQFNYVFEMFRISRNDIIYLQRTLYNPFLIAIAFIQKIIFRKKIVFDCCDPLFLIPNMRRKFMFLSRLSNGVVLVDSFARDYAKKYNPNVIIIPDSLPFSIVDNFQKHYTKTKDTPIIGWIGNGIDHFENLQIIAPALEKLAEEGVKFRFRLIGALKDKRVHDLFRPLGSNVEIIDTIEWGKTEVAYREIQDFDIALVPSVDREWFRVKTFLKPIESMGIGVITVISNIGQTAKLVKNGVNGFLAENTTNSWASVLRKVLSLSTTELEEISSAGRRDIKKDRDMITHIKRLKIFLEDIVNN